MFTSSVWTGMSARRCVRRASNNASSASGQWKGPPGAEITDAARAIAEAALRGELDPSRLTEERFRRFLDEPDIPDVDLFVRSSGEQRTSNFLLWQSAYAELVFLDTLWPDFDRRDLWRAIESYVRRDRRYGGAVPNQV